MVINKSQDPGGRLARARSFLNLDARQAMTQAALRARTCGSALALAGALAVGIWGGAARAGTSTWSGAGAGNGWNDQNNWIGNSKPPSGPDVSLVFTGSNRLANTQDILPSFTLNALTFDANAGAFVLGGNAIGFVDSPASVAPTLTHNGLVDVTINNNLSIASTLSISATGTGALTLAGSISGAGAIVQTGGALTLGGSNNSYTGGTTLQGGTLTLNSASALGSTGTIQFTGGTLRYSAANTTDYSSRFAYVSGSHISVDTNGRDVTFASTLPNLATVDKAGAGTLTFTAASSNPIFINATAGTVTIASGATVGQSGFLVAGFATVTNATLNLYGTLRSSSVGITTVGAGGVMNVYAGSTLNTGRNDVNTGGIINQYDGIADVNQTRCVGGTYVLVAGSLKSSGEFDSSGGTFDQRGGTHTVTGSVSIGLTNTLTSYLLSGGTFTAPSVALGYNTANDGGTALFDQTGGTAQFNGLNIGATGGQTATYNLTGGTLQTGIVASVQSNSYFNFNGGVLQARADTTGFMSNLTRASVRTGGAIVDSDGHAITISQPLVHDPAAGAPAIDGGFTKQGAGTLTLSGANTWTGETDVKVGTLIFAPGAVPAATPVHVYPGATLQYDGAALMPGFNSLTADAGGTILYGTGTTVTGGFLDGPGTHSFASGTSLTGTTIDSGAIAAVTGNAAFKNVTSGGAVSVAANQTLTWTGGSNVLGTLTVDGAANTKGWNSTGVTTIDPGGSLANSGNNLVLGGGSRTYVGTPQSPGGTLSTASATTIELNGGLLVNNGTVSGTTNVNYGGTARGAGTWGAVNVTSGGTFHPGNSPGVARTSSAIWGAGGIYEFDINDAAGAPGANYSQWAVSGPLTITSGTTSNSVFKIKLDSLTAGDAPGQAANFDPMQNYRWTIATADGGVTGLTSSNLAVDTSGFANAFNGTFNVSGDASKVYLNYAAVPEPTSSSLLAAAAGLLLARGPRRPRRRKRVRYH